MNSSSSQGYRFCQKNGCDTRKMEKDQLSTIFNVVCSLTEALTMAHDQLMAMNKNANSNGRVERSRNNPTDAPCISNSSRNANCNYHVALGSSSSSPCTHPLHMNPRRQNNPGRYSSSPRNRGMQAHVGSGGTNGMNISISSGANGGRYKSPRSFSRPVPPNTASHCIGTQYAALLLEEAEQLRARRLVKGTQAKWT